MKFGISIPQFTGDGAFDRAWFCRHLTRAEELGFESGWTQEQVFGSTPCLDPIPAMTYAAACTEKLRLGCVVFVTPLHNPVLLARSLSTLDQMSHGRLDVGVGTGAGSRMYSAFEVDPSSLIARFNEGLQVMKTLWTESDVTFSGRFWQLEGANIDPKPFQKPYPPLWFGARQPAALRRAVKQGDGFFGAGSATTAQFIEQVKVVRAALAEEGRDPTSFRIAKRVYIAVDEDVERARERVASWLGQFYGSRRLVDVAVFGPPEACVRGLREVADAGAELILFTLMFDEDEQMERLATEVMPQLA